MRFSCYLLVLLFLTETGISQNACTNLGQNPYSAFPICGTQTFTQSTVAICGGRRIVTPCTDDAAYGDIIPYWYKFTCYQSGTLSFIITPFNLDDDYDWQLFDVTGHNPSEVYTNPALFVACNWSQRPGITGASANGSGLVNCAGLAYPSLSSMPQLITGHNYLLMVSHFTQTQSGYQLQFGGGTAVITDNSSAYFVKANSLCNGKLGLTVNKKLQCSTLDPDGSDFQITGNAQIIGASSVSCSTGFDMDSINILFKNPLPPGDYTISVKRGGDGNTLLDACGVPMDEGKSITFTVPQYAVPQISAISFPTCPPDSLLVTFDNLITCSSIDPAGSDFQVTGPSPVTINHVSADCSDNGTFSVVLHFNSPILVQGDYNLQLKQASDGSNLLGYCGGTVADVKKPFTVYPTVSAAFTYSGSYTCDADTIIFQNGGENDIDKWTWTSNGDPIGSSGSVTHTFPTGNIYDIRLTVSNKGCMDTKDSIINFAKTKAIFSSPDVSCPEDSVIIVNSSTGSQISYLWDFGNGQTSSSKNPSSQKYPTTKKGKLYKIKLQVSSEGCVDTTSHDVMILSSCYIDVPNSFTPNGDGLNDYFYPLNALKAMNLQFVVYNRWGNKVFESKNYQDKWDGTFKGEPQPAGIYIWSLEYNDRDTKKHFSKKGTVMLIR